MDILNVLMCCTMFCGKLTLAHSSDRSSSSKSSNINKKNHKFFVPFLAVDMTHNWCITDGTTVGIGNAVNGKGGCDDINHFCHLAFELDAGWPLLESTDDEAPALLL